MSLAVERSSKLRSPSAEREKERETILRATGEAPKTLRKIVCRKNGRALLVPSEQILWFQVQDGMVHATTAKDSFWVSYQLAELEAALPTEEFFRARREVLVNISRIKEIKPYVKSSFLLVMSDAASTEIAVSERQARPLRIAHALMLRRAAAGRMDVRRRARSSVPSDHLCVGMDELCQVLHGVGNCKDRRIQQIRSPRCGIYVRIKEHQMRGPMWKDVAAVSLLRHHVAHRPRFHRRQFSPGNGISGDLADLRERVSRQRQLGDLGQAQKISACSRCVHTHRHSHFRIPVVGIRCGGPPASHDAYETVRTFDGSLESVTPQNQHLCMARNSPRRCTPSQPYLRAAIRHQVFAGEAIVG